MGILIEAKHALNSTIGTGEFKPLDVILESSVKRGDGLCANNTLYRTVVETATPIPLYENRELFRVNRDGSFYLHFSVELSGYPTWYFGYRIYKNGEIYKDISADSEEISPTYDELVVVSRGDVIGLQLVEKDAYQIPSLVRGIYVYASEVRLGAIDVLEG